MKKALILTSFMLLFWFSKSQNILLNEGFDTLNYCPTNLTLNQNTWYPFTHWYISYGTPDAFNFCYGFPPTNPQNNVFGSASIGNSFAGFLAADAVGNEGKETMCQRVNIIPGLYRFGFEVEVAKWLHPHVSPSRVKIYTNSVIPDTFYSSYFTDTTSWVSWDTIGVYLNAADTIFITGGGSSPTIPYNVETYLYLDNFYLETDGPLFFNNDPKIDIYTPTIKAESTGIFRFRSYDLLGRELK